MISTSIDSIAARRICAGIGALLVLLAACWIYSVESAQQARVAALDAMGGAVLEVGDAGTPDPEADMLVRVSGVPVVAQPVRDLQFGVSTQSPVLERRVEMLQWREVDTGMGPPRYQREWVDHPIDSSRFAKPTRHANPGLFPFPPLRFTAADVRVEGIRLDADIVDAIPGSEALLPDFATLPANLTASFQLHDGALYTSGDPQSPVLGDLRVSWHAVPDRPLTVLGLLHDGVLTAAPGLPTPGYVLLVDDIGLNGALPGLPNPPSGVWWQRVFAFTLAGVGVMLLQIALRRRMEVTAAGALAAVPLALMGAIIWADTRWLAALALLAAAVAAAAFAWQRMHSAK